MPSLVLSRAWFQTTDTSPAQRVFARHGRQASGSIDISEHMPESDTSDGPAGVNPKRRSKKGSFIQRTMGFTKERTPSDAGAGGAPHYMHCAGKNLGIGKDGHSIVCPDRPKYA